MAIPELEKFVFFLYLQNVFSVRDGKELEISGFHLVGFLR